MKKEGYLRPVRGKKILRVDTAAQRQKKDTAYYNPMYLVGHCVRVSESARGSHEQDADNKGIV